MKRKRSEVTIDDVIPINKLENEYFRYRSIFNFKSKPKLTPTTLKTHIAGQDKWKELLLSQYIEYLTDMTLVAVIQSKDN